MDISAIKNKVSLVDASWLTPHKLIQGYQDCPFCESKNKLRVKNNYYKCFHPACNKSGDLFKYLQDAGAVNSFSESLRFLSTKFFISGYSNRKDWEKHTDLIKKAFNVYKSHAGIESLDFLISRGYQDLESFQIKKNTGYAPEGTPLQNSGMALVDLVWLGLASKNGKEFYSNRVVFAIRDKKGRIAHLQGRALDPEELLRWKSTITPSTGAVKAVSDYLYGIDEAHLAGDKLKKTLCLCEGITDTLSLVQLGIPAVGSFGVNIDLVRHVELFEKFKTLVVLMDGDRFAIGTTNAGMYKSWSQIVKSLLSLQIRVPKLKIICLPPPSSPTIKDVNDWYKSGLTKEVLNSSVKARGLTLAEFSLKEFRDRIEYHPMLIDLVDMFPTFENNQSLNVAMKNMTKDGDVCSYLSRLKDCIT